MQTKRIAYYGLFASLSILMGYVEASMSMPLLIPGMKLGLANVIIVIVLYFMDTKAALFISLVRVILSGLLFAGFAGLLYSLAGAMFSFLVMAFLKKTDRFSIIGVSIAGGVFHNIGQIIVAAGAVENFKMFYYLPFLLFFGVATGTMIGIVAKILLKYLNHHL